MWWRQLTQQCLVADAAAATDKYLSSCRVFQHTARTTHEV